MSKRENCDFVLENSYLAKGLKYVGGMYEVGRGCLAGPVVAGIVIVSNESQFIEGVRDSKQMTAKQRIEKDVVIKESADAWGIGVASNKEIDELGIVDATNLAMQRAYEQVSLDVDVVLIDGLDICVPGVSAECIVHGDAKHFAIAASSVIAKVFRDSLMQEMAEKYGHYGFERNVGYGTKEHRDAIVQHGFCDIHRKSFSPIKEMVKGAINVGRN